MKNTGIVRKVDGLGRIVIPIEIRKIFDISKKSPLEIFTEEDIIILRPYKPLCYICSNSEHLINFKNKRICHNCITDIKKINKSDNPKWLEIKESNNLFKES